jgi:hypothetical protein
MQHEGNNPMPVRHHSLPAATRMFHLLSSNEASRAIRVAASLKLADILENGYLSPDKLAEAAGADASALQRLMRALISIDLFAENQDGSYSLSPLAETLLSGKDGSLRDFALRAPSHVEGEFWGDLLESVKTGMPSFETAQGEWFFDYLRHAGESADHFRAGMTLGSQSQAPFLMESFDFSPFKQIVDIGGGEGAFLAAILRANPNAHGMLMDMHCMVDNSNYLQSEEVSDRCEVIAGDFFEGAPSGGDLYILKAILHDWSDEMAIQILRNCRDALGSAKSGRVLVIEMVIPNGRKPHPAKFMDLNLLVLTPGGRERTQKEFRALFHAAGLKWKGLYRSACPLVIMEGSL